MTIIQCLLGFLQYTRQGVSLRGTKWPYVTCSGASTVASRALTGTSSESGHIRRGVCYSALLP